MHFFYFMKVSNINSDERFSMHLSTKLLREILVYKRTRYGL